MAENNSVFNQGIEFFKRGDYKTCTNILENLTREQPQKSLYWFNLGNCSFMLKDYERSANAFAKVLQLKSPLGPAAMLYEAKSFAALGKSGEAKSLLRKLLALNPPQGILSEARQDLNLLDHESSFEDQALFYYRTGNYEKAEQALNSRDKASLSDEDRLLLALSLVRQNKMYEAEKVLKSLLMNPRLPPEDRVVTADLLKKVRRNETEAHAYWLFLDLSYGLTDNAYLDGKSDGPISSPLLRGSLGFGYQFNQGKVLSEKLGYILNYEYPQKAPGLVSATHTFQSPLIFEKKNYYLNVMPYFQEQIWDQVEVSEKIGGATKAAFVKDDFEIGIDFDINTQTSTNANYAYLSGEGHSLRPYFGFWNKSVYTQLYWWSGEDGIQDIVYSDGTVLPMTQNYEGPGVKFIWRITARSSLLSNLNYTQRNYFHPAIPTNTIRKDNETDLSLKYTYALYPKFLLYFLGEFTNNSSSMGSTDIIDKNYKSAIFTFGFSWDVF